MTGSLACHCSGEHVAHEAQLGLSCKLHLQDVPGLCRKVAKVRDCLLWQRFTWAQAGHGGAQFPVESRADQEEVSNALRVALRSRRDSMGDGNASELASQEGEVNDTALFLVAAKVDDAFTQLFQVETLQDARKGQAISGQAQADRELLPVLRQVEPSFSANR